MAAERQQARRLVTEAEAGRVTFEEVVDPLGASGHAERAADRAELPRAEPPTVGERDLPGLAAIRERPQPIAVSGEPGVVALGELEGAVEGGPVDRGRVEADRRDAPGEEHLAETVRVARQVVERAEPAERLAEQAPSVEAEVVAQELGVGHDRVGPEVCEVVGLLLRGAVGEGRHRRRAAGAALVEQHDPVVVEGALEPPG